MTYAEGCCNTEFSPEGIDQSTIFVLAKGEEGNAQARWTVEVQSLEG